MAAIYAEVDSRGYVDVDDRSVGYRADGHEKESEAAQHPLATAAAGCLATGYLKCRLDEMMVFHQ
jgi:hypothetical protein